MLETTYNIFSGEVSINYTNFRDIKGEEEDVKFFYDLYEEKIKGSFKINIC